MLAVAVAQVEGSGSAMRDEGGSTVLRMLRGAAGRDDKAPRGRNHAQQDRLHWPRRYDDASRASPRPSADRPIDRRRQRQPDTEQGYGEVRKLIGPARSIEIRSTDKRRGLPPNTRAEFERLLTVSPHYAQRVGGSGLNC